MRGVLAAAAVALAVAALAAAPVAADMWTHAYKHGEEVPVLVNTVGPFKNPTETYSYFEKLPVCRPNVIQHRVETLGEVMEGNRLVEAGYDVHFRENMDRRVICAMTLTPAAVATFKEAIDNMYYFQLLIDDLPLGTFVGASEVLEGTKRTYYLYNVFDFAIEYNEDNIVRANLTNADMRDSYIDLDDNVDREIRFYYSVVWNENPSLDYDHRLDQFLQHPFFKRELEIHWLSILNSVILVVLLTSFLFIILMRVLRNDYARYSAVEVDPEDDAEDYGWKLIHGDVFRFPTHKMRLAAIVGSGTQFFILFFALLVLGGVGTYYPYNRGSMKTSIVIIYVVTSFVAGWISASLYKQMTGEKWVWATVMTAALVPGPLVIVWSVLNSIAWRWGSTQALPFGTVIALIVIYALIGFPLTVIGSIIGKNRAGSFDAPCRTRNIPREIPAAPWYHSAIAQLLMAGFLPFSAISIELYYIFATVWGHKLYTLYGILLIVFAILVIVTSFITVALTYFQLSVEDYRWWWRSIMNGGASAFFVYAYAIFFYTSRSAMSGVLQGSFFFGYMLIICWTFFLMMGSVGFWSALFFVRQIYKNFKSVLTLLERTLGPVPPSLD